MCGMCNCCPVIVPNDSCGAKACCYKSCPLSSDPRLWNSGKILLYEVSVPTDNTISPAPRPPQPIPPLRHPRYFSCTWLIQAALFMSHKWCHCVIFFFFSKGCSHAVFLQRLQMPENRLRLSGNAFIPFQMRIWEKAVFPIVCLIARFGWGTFNIATCLRNSDRTTIKISALLISL